MTVTIEINGQTYTLSDEVMKALESISERTGLSLEQAIAQAVVNENLLEHEMAAGGELLVRKGGEFHRLEYA
jgi:hypothetical protein